MAQAQIVIDRELFWQRLMKLHKAWNVSARLQLAAFSLGHSRSHRPQGTRDKEGVYKGADALVIDTGSASEEELYSKSAALQTWLLGYEFPDTIIAICSRSITVLTSSKKGTSPHPPPVSSVSRHAPASHSHSMVQSNTCSP